MQFVSRGYWDPEESTREKWTNTYASELQERGLSQDFTGLSELLLGQAQPAQFQSSTDEQPTGWIWGSKLNEDGEVLGLTGTTTVDGTTYPNNRSSLPNGNPNVSATLRGGNWIENNSRSEIPRAYHEATAVGYGDYYNWYAATAETGTFAQTSGSASDSICPKGWQLPVISSEAGSKSYYNLIANAYGLISVTGVQSDENSPLGSATEASKRMRQIPISLITSGYYWYSGNGVADRASGGNFWTSTPSPNGVAAYDLSFTSNVTILPTTYYVMTYGFSARCVQK